ncbi:MAG: bifunctional hydroxymethylpyrimidine kinase/phosphomethylpyrimidine kinase, partial [Planctomycetaceae bacterium]|nr:bifunctional hydroxymethylpyrimidine kinase/phosphomethylpyrimidine kinase [Planctomycetaceae bacterium]
NRAREVHWCASGKVLNVGLALTQLGASVRTLSLIGGGSAGDAMREDMADLGVDVRWIESSVRQRVCTTLLDRESGQTTEIVENSPATAPAELAAFEVAFAEEAASSKVEFVILTGSLPNNSPSDYYARLLDRTRAKAILDIRGAELLATWRHAPFLVKPNHEELAQTVQRPLPTVDDVWNAMREIHEFGAEWVVVTNGPHEVLASHVEQRAAISDRFRFDVPHVEVVNPIGCGDCFTAGLACALQRGSDMSTAIRSGIAAAAKNAEQLMPARLA